MINENLMKLRKIHKLTQEEVAGRIKVSRQAVSKWETGETLPDINNCLALAELYDVSVDHLLNYSEKETGVVIPPKGKHLFGTVTIGDRGQIVIPKKARQIFDLQPGDSLLILGDETQGLALVKTKTFMNLMNEVQNMMEDK